MAIMPESPDDADFAEAIASVESELGTFYRRVRTTWSESAVAVHPSLQPIGYKILSALVQHETAHVGTLGEQLAIDKSVMSRQIRMLEEFELLTVGADPNDGRARILTPTPFAVERVPEVRARNRHRLPAVLRDWTPDELRVFSGLLGRFGAVAEAVNPER